MRAVLVGLLVFLVVALLALVWYARDRQGTWRAEQLGCAGAAGSGARLVFHPLQGRLPRDAPIHLALLVENEGPTAVNLSGQSARLEHYAARWDGRYALHEVVEVVLQPPPERAEVPPGESRWIDGRELPTHKAGEHVFVARLGDLCGVGRYVVL